MNVEDTLKTYLLTWPFIMLKTNQALRGLYL